MSAQISQVEKELSKSDNEKFKRSQYELIASGPNYDGTGIRTSLHGTIYQINLLMLFMSRGLKRGYTFSLATEINAADKFDDIVFKYEVDGDEVDEDTKYRYRFLQAKHKQDYSLKVTESDLTNQTEDDFSLQKYFNSFLKIKYAKRQFFKGQFEDFILCTNLDIDTNIEKYFYPLTDEDPLLGFDEKQIKKQTKRLKLRTDTDLLKKLRPILRKVQSTDINPDHLKIAKKIGKNVASSTTITNDKKNLENRDWMMRFIFDKDTKEIRGSQQRPKYYYKLQKHLTDPPEENENLIELSSNFLEGYIEAISQNAASTADAEKYKKYLKETFFEVADKFENAKSKNKQPSNEADLDDFLKKFVLAVNQPTEEELKYIVEMEVGQYMSLIDGEFIASRLQRGILDWAKTRHGKVLTVEDCQVFFSNIEIQLAKWGQFAPSITLKSQINKLNCWFDFENDKIKRLSEFLSGKENGSLILVYNNLLLSQIKLMQVIKKSEIYASADEENELKDDAFLVSEIDTLLDLKDTLVCPLKAFRSRSCNLMLVILDKGTELKRSHAIIVQKVFDIIAEMTHKQVVFLMPAKNDHFKSLFRTQTFREIYDTYDAFCDLSVSTQHMLLKESKVRFQGSSVILNKILNDINKQRVLGGNILMKIIEREFVFKLDDEDEAYKEIKDFCVDRFLYRCISISTDILKDDNFIVAFHCDNIDVIQNKEILLITDVGNKNDFEKLSLQYKETVHWLKQENNELLWQASSGSIIKLRKYQQNQEQYKEPERQKIHPFELDKVDIFDSELEDEYMSHFSIMTKKTNESDITEQLQYIKLNHVDDIDDKIVIICAEPGMGKSTIISHLVAKNKLTISEKEGTCVIKANLRDYSQYFKDHPQNFIYTLQDAENFIYEFSKLSQICERIRRDDEVTYLMCDDIQRDVSLSSVELLGRELFSYLYNNEKIVLLLDGFDEIAPNYTELVLSLLEALKQCSLLKVWVSTRLSDLKLILENRLNTFSYNVKPFNINEQLQFISNFWQYKLHIIIEREKLIFFLHKHMLIPILQIEQNQIYDQSVFMGNPLHLLMVSTIYVDKFSAYYKSGFPNIKFIKNELTLYDLYHKFIDIKFKILYSELKEKLADTRYVADFTFKFKEIVKKHQKLALMDMFSINDIPDLFVFEEEACPDKSAMQKIKILSTLLESVTTGAEKTGIVMRVSNGRPSFIHRTFAEYFIAELLTEALKIRESPKYVVAKQLLYKIITSGQQNCVLLFINYKVVSGTQDAPIFNAALGLEIQDLSLYYDLRDKFGRSPVHYMMSSGKRVCANSQAFPNANFDCLYIKDKLFNWTPLHYGIVSHDCSSMQLFFNTFDVVNKNENDLKDDFGSSPYILAARRGCSSLCTRAYLLELPLSIDAQDNDGMTALHYALARTDSSAGSLASQLIAIGADLTLSNNKNETAFEIILSQKDERALHALVRRVYDAKSPKIFVSKFEEYIAANKDFCIFLLSRNLELTQILIENVPDLDINICDSMGKTALHYSFQRLHLDGSDTLLCLLERNADISCKDNNGKLPAYFDYDATMKIFRDGHSPKLFTALNEMTGKSFKKMEPLILSMELNVDITVQILSRYKHIANILLSHGDVIDVPDACKKTALHYAVMWRRPQNVGYLLLRGANAVATDVENKTPLEYLGNVICTDQINSKIQTKQKKVQRILFYLLKYGAYFDVNPSLREVGNLIDSIRKLFLSVILGNIEEVKTILNTADETQVIVNAKTKQSTWTPIYYAVFKNHTEIVKELLSQGASYIVTDQEDVNQEIKNILNLVQNFMLAVQNNNIDEVIQYLEQSKMTDITHAVVNASYTHVHKIYGNMIFQPLHLALDNNNADIVKILLQNGAKTNFKASGEKTVLHIACERSNRSLNTLLDYLSKDDLYEMFLQEDMYQKTPLIYAILLKDLNNLNTFLDKCVFFKEEDKYDGKRLLGVVGKAVAVANITENIEVIRLVKGYFRKCHTTWDPLKNVFTIRMPDEIPGSSQVNDQHRSSPPTLRTGNPFMDFLGMPTI